MTEPLVVRRETAIAAPPAAVFAFLTDPDKILSWMGAEATTEAHPGGLYLVKGTGDRTHVARGAFREVVPGHRLAHSFGWEGNEAVPPGSSLVEMALIDQDGGALLRVTHTGLPNVAQCATTGVGRITWAGWPLRQRAEILASIVAPRRAILNPLLWAVDSQWCSMIFSSKGTASIATLWTRKEVTTRRRGAEPADARFDLGQIISPRARAGDWGGGISVKTRRKARPSQQLRDFASASRRNGSASRSNAWFARAEAC
jgi:uncharacterized protein YndB with AHSA1/START domain